MNTQVDIRWKNDELYRTTADIRGWFKVIARVRGYRVRVREPGGRFASRSWCNPLTRTVWLRSTANLHTIDGAALLAHEVAHVRQQSGPWWYRWAWGLRYLADPWFRRDAEIEAEAWWVAVMVRLTDGGVLELAQVSHSLGHWRSPHYTPGDPDEMTRRIAARAEEILNNAT